MRKISFIVIAGMLFLCSCSTPKIANTIWCTVSSATNGDKEGLIIESLYFKEGGQLDIIRSIASESGMEVSPYKYAGGTYETIGSLKKNAPIVLTASTFRGDSVRYMGFVDVKKHILALYDSADSTVTTYLKNSNVVIKEYKDEKK